MKALICLALSGAAIAASAQTPAAASAAPTPVVRTASSSPVTTGAQETFAGTVRISSPFQAQAPGRAGGATVSFEARARTAWHTHPLGQVLVVTAGLGIVQQAGQPAQAIRPGDVVSIPANVRHWHGAGPDGSMSHVAIAERADGISVTWQDKVSDQDYAAAVTSAGLASTNTVETSAGPVAQSVGEPRAPVRTQPRSEILSPKQRTIPVIASAMATSDMPKLNAALNQALDAGMTVSEAKEILVQLYAYAGFPKSLNALGELMRVVDTRKQRGIQDAPGRGPSRPIATGNELVAAGKANQTEISGGPVQGPLFDFAPVINQFLQAHLFGDIFERDNLDWQSRELATVGALATMPGVEAQLLSHMRASLRVGLSAAQLRQLAQVLAERGNPDAAHRADEALTRALAAASKG
jgi:4-carboxymuconolactone decarboxylase